GGTRGSASPTARTDAARVRVPDRAPGREPGWPASRDPYRSARRAGRAAASSKRRSGRPAQRQIGRDAGEQHHPDPMVVEEGTETGLALAMAAGPELAEHQQEGQRKPGPVPGS